MHVGKGDGNGAERLPGTVAVMIMADYMPAMWTAMLMSGSMPAVEKVITGDEQLLASNGRSDSRGHMLTSNGDSNR